MARSYGWDARRAKWACAHACACRSTLETGQELENNEPCTTLQRKARAPTASSSPRRSRRRCRATPPTCWPRPLPLKGLADAVNVTDGAGARAASRRGDGGRDPAADGIEPILQFTCRDRNRIALQSDLMAAAALGIRNLLLLKRRRSQAGRPARRQAGVRLRSPPALTKVAVALRDKGELPTGRKVGGKADFFIGAADVPIDPPAGWEPKSLKAKIDGRLRVRADAVLHGCRRGAPLHGAARRARRPTAAVPDRHFAAALGQVGALDASEKLFGTIIPDAIDRAPGGAPAIRPPKAASICLDLMRELADHPRRCRRATSWRRATRRRSPT